MTFDEAKHNRHSDGKFANKPHSEAEGVSLTPPQPESPSVERAANSIAEQLRAGEGHETLVRTPITDVTNKQLAATGVKFSHIDTKVTYNEGGLGRARGYYLSVRPVNVENGIVETVMSRGFREGLVNASRRGKAARARANSEVTPERVAALLDATIRQSTPQD